MKYKLGDFIELIDIRNRNKYGKEKVLGISTKKEFIPTKANLEGVNLNSYKCVPRYSFAYVADTSRRGDKISLAYNSAEDIILVSSISTVFKVKENSKLLPDYLYMYFNRPEFDRYTRFNSWGSARETFTWEDMCNIEIKIPSLAIQKKYVTVYKSMLRNQKVYEEGLEDLKTASYATIDKIKHLNKLPLSSFIEERNEKNANSKVKMMKGIGLNGFIEPNQRRSAKSRERCKIFYLDDFVYAPSSLKNGVIWINKDYNKAICTEEYVTFYNKTPEKLNSSYLLLYLKRDEFMRFIEFTSIDSVRNRFYFGDIQKLEVPVPNIKIQNSIANLYDAYVKRKHINEYLKKQISDICRVLIKGSLEEVANSE